MGDDMWDRINGWVINAVLAGMPCLALMIISDKVFGWRAWMIGHGWIESASALVGTVSQVMQVIWIISLAIGGVCLIAWLADSVLLKPA
jgi:hypothetical protein